MSSRDTSYRPPSISDSEDTPPETTCSQVTMSSVGTPKTTSLSQSLEVFTFSTPTPSPSPRIRKPKRKLKKYQGNQFGTKRKDTSAKKFVKVGTTTVESVRVPSSSKGTLAMRKLDFGSTSSLPTTISMKVRSPEGKVEAVDVLPGQVMF